jgi:hypothetical protein
MKTIYILLLFCFFNCELNAQLKDTISGNFDNLKINKGIYYINSPVKVQGDLEILPGATIEISDPGVLVCFGDIIINGNQENRINIIGNKNSPGIGIIVKSENAIDQVNLIDINYAIFSNLQLPLFFDFGWKRSSVNVMNNIFIDNIGYVSTIQVLNPPFLMLKDSIYTDFKIKNNLFTGNNGALYFEDFCSDNIKIEINNNTFYDNHIYGINNYNITSNFLNGRMDQKESRFNPTITNNNFQFNYLFDINTGSFVHLANFGIYGSSKSINLKNNYWGTNDLKEINKSIYDQKLNYNTPEAEIEPFLIEPDTSTPVHIYSIKDLDNNIIHDTIKIVNSLDGFIFKSNNKIDFSNSQLILKYFINDSSVETKDTIISFDLETNDLEYKFSSKTNLEYYKYGYYHLSKLKDISGGYVPDVKIGYLSFLNELRKRRLFEEALIVKKADDSLNLSKSPIDSIQNTFQKIEAPIKSRIELGLHSGGSIFTGTISQKGNIFSNDVNMLLGINFQYILFSKLSIGLMLESFKLSNSDNKSNNNEQLKRGMSFSTSMISISPSINYDIIDNRLYTKARKFRPSLGVGMDIVRFNPTGIYNGTKYDLRSLGTGGQYSDITKNPYSLLTYGYFLNLKLKYQLNRFNNIGFNISYHNSFSNYLDDVGADPYPSISSIENSQISNKDAAIYFTNPTSRNVTGQFRNNPDNARDSYLNIGFFYSIKLFK